MDLKRVLLLLAALFLLTANITAQDVRYNFAKSADFTKYKTYKWITLDGEKLSETVDQHIKSAVDAELTAKGLTKSESDGADLLIGYQGSVTQDRQLTTYGTDWGYGGGWNSNAWYGPSMGPRIAHTHESIISVGQLSVDMYDTANHVLVWRGVVTKTLTPKAKHETRERNLKKAITKLLNNFPPAAT